MAKNVLPLSTFCCVRKKHLIRTDLHNWQRNIISPEISLHTAKIVYNWNIRLESGSIRTKVDPTEAIHVTWTDRSMNGRWVTDCSLPLKGTSLKALAASVRVRRQFTF